MADFDEVPANGDPFADGYEPGGSALPPGASRSYRNNNPGNLVYSPFSARHGAIGKDAQGFAIFPSVQDGPNAQAALWQTSRYAERPLGQAVKGWGGLYGKQLGIDPAQTYSQLPPEQQQAVLARQKQMEGWIPPPGMNAVPPPSQPMPLGLTSVSGAEQPSPVSETMGPEGGIATHEPANGDPFAGLP